MSSTHSANPSVAIERLLPQEIWHHLCSFLPKPSLLQFRLVSTWINHVCKPLAFREMSLKAYGDSSSRFIQIAKSQTLRQLVQELTIDTWVGPEYEYQGNHGYPEPVEFMNALPYLHLFCAVKTLHLNFNEYCGDEDRASDTIEETWMFRYRVLDTVFHCLTGLWTPAKQASIDETANLDWLEPMYPPEDLNSSLSKPIQLKEFTITNLADYHDIHLAASDAWKKFVSSHGPTALKIFITTEVDIASPEMAIFHRERYDMFEAMPRNWLHPDLSNNLRVLSLYYRDYWGWVPKMDFRLIGSHGHPFPQLKVLALGNYVFSHEWQIDWFASVGKGNVSGGLEELYLDDCPILFEADQAGPLDANDPLYPLVDVILNPDWNIETHKIPLRWHKVLSKWKESMPELKVFRMGHGSWDGAPWAAQLSLRNDKERTSVNDVTLKHKFCNQAHRTYDCPEFITEEREDMKYMNGAGLSCTRRDRLQYISYDIGIGPSQWLETNRDYYSQMTIFAPEDGTVEKDDHAYEVLMDTLKAKGASYRPTRGWSQGWKEERRHW